MKNKLPWILAVLGVLLAGTGVLLLAGAPGAVPQAFPYVCIGLGCGLFGQGAGELIHRRADKTNPAREKEMRIEQNDERNRMIALYAKAKAFDVMITVFGALALVYTLISAGLAVTLLLVSAYLFVIGCSLYYRREYGRKM